MAIDSESIFDGNLADLEIPGFDSEVPAEGQPVQEEAQQLQPSEGEGAQEVEQEVAAGTAEGDSAAADPAKAAAAAAKLLKFKAGEKEIELDETAVVPWKVDGKTEMVAVKDLLNNYAGKVAYDKRFTELSKQREEVLQKAQETESQKSKHAKLINAMHQSVTEGRLFDAIQSMLEISGLDKRVDARAYTKQLREALVEQAKKLSELSPEARQLKETEEEKDFLKSKYERELKARDAEQAERAFQARVSKAIASVNSNLEEFVKTRDVLVQELRKRNEDVSLVTPEFVAEHLKDLQDYTAAKQAIVAVNPELIKNQQLWDDAVKMLRLNPEWTVKDLEGILRQATKNKRAQEVSQRVQQTPTPPAAKPRVRTPAKDYRTDFSNFSSSDVEW